jgi:hypothetical protein
MKPWRTKALPRSSDDAAAAHGDDNDNDEGANANEFRARCAMRTFSHECESRSELPLLKIVCDGCSIRCGGCHEEAVAPESLVVVVPRGAERGMGVFSFHLKREGEAYFGIDLNFTRYGRIGGACCCSWFAGFRSRIIMLFQTANLTGFRIWSLHEPDIPVND